VVQVLSLVILACSAQPATLLVLLPVSVVRKELIKTLKAAPAVPCVLWALKLLFQERSLVRFVLLVALATSPA
jgi:hypothetical protein